LADRNKLQHSVPTLQDLQHILNSEDVGENIQRGASVQEMHCMSLKEGTLNCRNILRGSYLEFGMGTAMGRRHDDDDDNNKLYMVQLFRGRPKNSNNNTQRRRLLDNHNNNNSSSSGATTLGRLALDNHHQQPHHQQQQQLVDAAATTTVSDNVMDRFLLCSFCW
jgi:hypothetical protein